jgi:hypothetical protein
MKTKQFWETVLNDFRNSIYTYTYICFASKLFKESWGDTCVVTPKQQEFRDWCREIAREIVTPEYIGNYALFAGPYEFCRKTKISFLEKIIALKNDCDDSEQADKTAI